MALWHVSMLCSFSGPSNIPHGWATTLFMCRWVLGSRLQVLVCVGGVHFSQARAQEWPCWVRWSV